MDRAKECRGKFSPPDRPITENHQIHVFYSSRVDSEVVAEQGEKKQHIESSFLDSLNLKY